MTRPWRHHPILPREHAGILLFVVFCALIGVLAIGGMVYDYRRTEDQARRHLEYTTDLIAEWIIGAFQTSDYLLRDLAGLVEDATLAYPHPDPQAQQRLTERLIAKQDSLSHAFLVGAVDQDCIVTHTNAIPGFDASERPYCTALRDNPNVEMVITQAYVSNLHQINVTQARRLASESGEFRGLVAIGVDLEFFSVWLDRIEVGEAGSIAIIDTAGLLLARKPMLPKLLGQQVSDPQLSVALSSAAKYRVVTGASPIDGVVRIFGIRRVADLPFVVIIGVARHEMLSDWWERTLIFSGIIALLWLMSALFLRSHLQMMRLRQERLEQQRRFMSMLTHEIRTPLAVLRLRLDAGTPSQGMQQRAQEAVSDLEAIIERCALSVRLEDEVIGRELERCDVPALLHKLILTQQRAQNGAQQGHIHVHEPIPPEARELRTDPVLLRTIVSNLLDNAVKYAPAGALVDISVRAHQRDDQPGLCLSVTNPVAPNQQPDPARLFEKYYRAPDARRCGGSGLGLYIARGLARQLAGNLRASREGDSLCFELWLPTDLGH